MFLNIYFTGTFRVGFQERTSSITPFYIVRLFSVFESIFWHQTTLLLLFLFLMWRQMLSHYSIHKKCPVSVTSQNVALLCCKIHGCTHSSGYVVYGSNYNYYLHQNNSSSSRRYVFIVHDPHTANTISHFYI